MNTAKLFKNGQSQAVRLPKDCRFEGKDVYIKKVGDIVMLIPKNLSWDSWWNNLEKAEDDFMDDRNQPELQERDF